MNEGPKPRKKSRWLVVAALGLSLLVMMGIGGYRVFRVAALQNSLTVPDGAAFASLRDGGQGPKWAVKAADSLTEYLDLRETEEFVWRERLVAVFRAETDSIGLTNTDSFREGFAPALQRFPKLRAFGILDHGTGTLTKADVDMLMTLLRSMEHLETIGINTPHLTDASFAKLAGHPRLNRVLLTSGSFSPEILETLKTLPNLKEFSIITRSNDTAWRSEYTKQLYRNALPGTTVTFLP